MSCFTNECLCCYLLGWRRGNTKRPGMMMALLGRSCADAQVLGCCAPAFWLQVCKAAWIAAASGSAGPHTVSKWHHNSEEFR